MRVLILYQFFQGANEPGHNLMVSFARFLNDMKEDVSVVSGEYGYMQPKAATMTFWRRFVRSETVESTPTIRTFTYGGNYQSWRGRLLSLLSFSISCLAGLLRGPRPDVVFASSPPLLPIFSAWLAARIWGAPLVLEICDLWPASFAALTGSRNKVLIRAMAWLERFLYDRSAYIVALTEGIRRNIIERGWPEQKVHVMGYGISAGRFFPDGIAAGRVRAEEGWGEERVVMYLGAHGLSNNLDVILRAAHRLHDRPDIRFVLIGDGFEKSRLVGQARSMALDNVRFHPPIPASAAPAYINAADLCVATLRDLPLFRGAIPSKLIEYMACGKAVLLGVRGEAQGIVEDAGAGVVFAPDDDQQLAALIRELTDDPERCKAMGRNGSAYANAHFVLECRQDALHALLIAASRRSAERN